MGYVVRYILYSLYQLSLLWLYYCYPFVASQGMLTYFYPDVFSYYLELDASALRHLDSECFLIKFHGNIYICAWHRIGE